MDNVIMNNITQFIPNTYALFKAFHQPLTKITKIYFLF